MSEIDNAAEPEGAPVFQMQHDLRLRDWFAGQALMSMLSAPDKISDSTYSVAAGLSYKFADAMLEARKVKP